MYTAFIVYCKCGVKKGLPLCLLLLLDVTSTNVKDQMSQNLSSPPFYIVGRGCVGVCVVRPTGGRREREREKDLYIF